MAFAYFILMGIDSNDVREANEWCNDDLKGLTFDPPELEIVCGMSPYIVTCVLDFLASATWVRK